MGMQVEKVEKPAIKCEISALIIIHPHQDRHDWAPWIWLVIYIYSGWHENSSVYDQEEQRWNDNDKIVPSSFKQIGISQP